MKTANCKLQIGDANREPASKRVGRMVWQLAALLLLTVPSTGCLSELILAGYLIGGPPSIEPDFEIQTKLSMTDKAVVVAVVCYAPLKRKLEFDQIDKEIAKYVSYRMVEHKIRIVNPDRVNDWLDRNDDWDKPEEIGAALGATYVVYIDLNDFSLYEENSHNLYRGRAEVMVSVIQIDPDGTGDEIYSKEHISRFPLAVPRSTYDVTYSNFKRQYLTRLSEEIGRLFYEHYNGDDIPDAM